MLSACPYQFGLIHVKSESAGGRPLLNSSNTLLNAWLLLTAHFLVYSECTVDYGQRTHVRTTYDTPYKLTQVHDAFRAYAKLLWFQFQSSLVT